MIVGKSSRLAGIVIAGCALLCSLGARGGPVVNDPMLLQAITGLARPVAARHAGDGSGRLFIVQRDGLVRIFDGASVLATPFLDLSALTATGNSSDERGFLGLDFHPQYLVNGRFFVYYTDLNSDTVVAEYGVSVGDPNVADPAGTILLRVDQDFSNHNGGDLHFGPDGYLYIGLGDGGSGGDPCERAQTLNPATLNNGGSCAVDSAFTNSGGNANSRALLGKMLRIDVDATTAAGANDLCASTPGTGAAAYAIPGDNPFLGADPNSGCAEVWAYGLRNPYRFSFDRTAGDLWIGDVGQNAREEVDLQDSSSPGGEDYGWDDCEGVANFEGANCPDGNGRTGPVMDYSHSGGRCSLTGGYLYRGPVTQFLGSYFFGDYCTGEVFQGDFDGANWNFTLLFNPNTDPSGFCDGGFCLSGFGEDESGNVYAIDFGGTIYLITENDLLFSSGFE